MTFVLNLLHSDFSILLADRKAKVDGPATISVGGFTINASNLTITGYKKIAISAGGTLAAGMAGSVQDHPYFPAIAASDDQTCLRSIFDTVRAKFSVTDRSVLGGDATFMENQGIATLFDPLQSAFFSLLYVFSEVSLGKRWFRGAAKAMLLHVGTGSSNFEKAVGLAEINSFIASVTSVEKVGTYLPWLAAAFEKVAQVDDGVSKQFEGYIATRQTPQFRHL